MYMPRFLLTLGSVTPDEREGPMPRTVDVACGFGLILTVDRDSRPTLKGDFFFFACSTR